MCITANKHVHALKSWMEVPNGWKLTGFQFTSQTYSAFLECSRTKSLWFGACGNYCERRYTIPQKLHLGIGSEGKCTRYIGCSGTMKTTLRMCGKVRLKFGNCGNFGYVVAKLNGKQVGRVDGYQSKTLVLAFKDGDILELADNPEWDVTGTIELSSLDIISCSTC